MTAVPFSVTVSLRADLDQGTLTDELARLLADAAALSSAAVVSEWHRSVSTPRTVGEVEAVDITFTCMAERVGGAA